VTQTFQQRPASTPTPTPAPSSPRPGYELQAPQTQRRRSRPGVVIAGVFLIVLFALAGVLWELSSTPRRSVLALRHDLKRGAVVQREDLRIVELGTDADLAVVSAADWSSIVGKAATTDLRSGTVVAVEHFSAQSQMPEGMAMIGLRLEPGEVPSASLRPGDRVNVILTGKQGDAQVPADPEVLVRGAEVAEVRPDGDQGRRFVSLLVGERESARVSGAAAQQRVRLVQVAGPVR
jgi:Flp pilus assembly protein CpaB